MGCFISTSKKPSPPPPSKPPQSKSPPPSSIEEETVVKEILTEFESTTPTTLIPKPKKSHSPFIKTAPLLHTRNKNGAGKAFSDENSEICSNLSESVSISTNVTEKTEDFHEVRQKSPAKMRNRSYSGEMRRERTVGKSPGRVRSGCGYVRRGENGESSGRRSRSPVTRTDPTRLEKPGLGRTQSGRKTGKSPGRVGSGLGDRTRKLEGEKEWPPTMNNSNNNELIENPLVSLECFIFL